MTIIVPADSAEVNEAVLASATVDGPVYIRVAGFAADMSPLERRPPLCVGKATLMRDGRDLTFIATGTTVRTVLEVAEALAADGIEARVLNMHTVKPIDQAAIRSAATDTKRIITVEEHSVVGALGGAVAEVMAEAGVGKLRRIGVQDRFCTEIAPYQQLLEGAGLDASSIEAAAREFVA